MRLDRSVLAALGMRYVRINDRVVIHTVYGKPIIGAVMEVYRGLVFIRSLDGPDQYIRTLEQLRSEINEHDQIPS